MQIVFRKPNVGMRDCAQLAFHLHSHQAMENQHRESKFQALQDLSSAQVTAIVQRTGESREEVAARLGCGTSQLFKYEKEGLPPRMNRQVRAAILQLGIETDVLPANAAIRAVIAKLSKD